MINYSNPVKIEFGAGSLTFLPRFLKGRKALLVTSKSFVSRGQVDLLVSSNPSIVKIISDIQSNPTVEQVLEYREKLDFQEFDVIIALGGGSVIDISKAFSVYKEAETLDFEQAILEGLENIVFKTKPVIAIPTTAGTGSEVTQWGTIWDEVNKKKYSISHPRLYCEAAILDPELHVTIPEKLTIQTGLDALSHSLEALWNKNATPITDEYAIHAAKMILDILPDVTKDLENIQLREKMLLASYYAGLAFSHTQTAIAHAMSYYMTLNKGIPHGIAASITLPVILEAALNIDGVNNNLRRVFPKDSNPVQELIDLFNKINVDILLNNYQVSIADLHEIEKSLSYTNRSANSVLKFRDLNFESWMVLT